jgi:hypothetical protein
MVSVSFACLFRNNRDYSHMEFKTMKKSQNYPLDLETMQKLREAWLKKSLTDLKVEIPLPKQCRIFRVKKKFGFILVGSYDIPNKPLILHKLGLTRLEHPEKALLFLKRGYEE